MNGKDKYTVLVGGAAGKQGRAVINLLLKHGHNVIAYVHSKKHPYVSILEAMDVKIREGDISDAEALSRAAAEADVIFSITIPFGKEGAEGEIRQGKTLADTSKALKKRLIYSSVAGIRAERADLEHTTGKRIVEDYIMKEVPDYTIVAPVYFMENLFNFDFNQLRRDIYALPLSPGLKIDQVTVLDIAGTAVHAVEHPEKLSGKRVEVASDIVSGEDVVEILSGLLGRKITYYHIPDEQVRKAAGDAFAKMYRRFEEDPYHIDIKALHEKYPEVGWHTFKEWTKTIDWSRLLPR